MSNSKIYLGNTEAHLSKQEVKGELVTIQSEEFYKISNVDSMRPFFMSIVSDSNHWMFISSTGSLSAGRKNSDSALFPYYTDDKITESEEVTGSKTLLLVSKSGKKFLWEPFSRKLSSVYKITRNLYKNSIGNKIIFEEINHDLELKFSYQWNSSDKHGFVRKSNITNNGSSDVELDLLDGIQNIVPSGVNEELQNRSSNLVDAYKKCELETDTGLGVYSLSAIIVDKAEPSEALKANTVWSYGLTNPKYLLSSLQIENFRRGDKVIQENNIRAEKGAYFLNTSLTLSSNKSKNWMIVANVNQTVSDIIYIKKLIKNNPSISTHIENDIKAGSKHLIEIVGSCDGIQITADKLRNIRHFSNSMFNLMRGGIFDNSYQIEKSDFIPYISNANKEVYENNIETLNSLPILFSLGDLKLIYEKNDDTDFERLCFEYLPLKFSRRHGDPSRPWNKFSINTKSEEDGSKILDYQGNWRDIFQNWESLAHSYPEFIDGMIHKFLNATTFEGYNPYRVTKDGFDWETVEPDNPWAYIGYWGDHQIIYLLKFLEFIEDYYPSRLLNYFSKNVFVYANVPYKIKSYEQILVDSKNTIDFDHENEKKIQDDRKKNGVDGALLKDPNNNIYKINFIEKILATVLSKLSNFIPEGGIWMNTQRPEWNDANNALVGNGVSMVTLYYLRRFLNFFDKTLNKSKIDKVGISLELFNFYNEIHTAFQDNKHLLSKDISDIDRKVILDLLGKAGSIYRNNIYSQGFSSDKQNLSIEKLKSFIKISLAFLDHSILANKRKDNLYHAYNLMSLQENGKIIISSLPEMLEGQVAILSSGYLSASESLKVLDSLKQSKLFRKDQSSYTLYPNKDLGRFIDKNNIGKENVLKSTLLQKLIEDGNSQIINKDLLGGYHFNGNFNNANCLIKALKMLPEHYNSLLKNEMSKILQIFEQVFDHKSFTGRSGTFFGYEGLGSIYWHMVSKLLLAVFEVIKSASQQNEDKVIVNKLIDHYFEINEGIGVKKSPELYGAFPTDPYSHTPEGKGAQQPGMTGQVKEDLLSRFGELGIQIDKGVICFNPEILKNEEFLNKTQIFNYINLDKKSSSIKLEKNSLGFTYCQVPIIYQKSTASKITVYLNNGKSIEFNGKKLNDKISSKVFKRTDEVNKIVVFVIKNNF